MFVIIIKEKGEGEYQALKENGCDNTIQPKRS